MNQIFQKTALGITIMSTGILIMTVIFGLFNGVISAIWLLLIGQGKFIGIGIIVAVLMPIIYTVLTIPTHLLIPVSTRLIEGRKKRGMIIGLLASIYEKGILYIWLIYVFGLFQVGNNLSGISTIPAILWGYTITLGPLSYMAKKGGDNQGIGTTLGILVTIIGYILMTIFWYFKLSNFVLYGIPFLIYLLSASIPPMFLFNTINSSGKHNEGYESYQGD